jgi:hypothetical protein
MAASVGLKKPPLGPSLGNFPAGKTTNFQLWIYAVVMVDYRVPPQKKTGKMM